MSEQSKAVELANQYESERLWDDVICSEWINSAASELRRLDAENAALRAQLAQSEPVGWKLVPETPDAHMREALASPEATELEWWQKILSVSPPAPQQAPAENESWGTMITDIIEGTKSALSEMEQQAPVDEREAFEAWARKAHEFDEDMLKLNSELEYHYAKPANMFEAWQARAALKPAVPIHSTEECPSPECETCPERSPCSLEEQKYPLKPAVPQGYQLVPIETTWDIVKAGIAAFDMSSAPSEAMRKAYKAMLAAAAKDGE